ncbi:MAG: hypothetical protein FWD69_05370 [Polyangiaceae bacterium]|nr:hypothetical protein [Polyangiaceae bacterium]
MRAAFLDPQGGKLTRLLPFIVLLALIIAGANTQNRDLNILAVVLVFVAAFLPMLPLRQRRARSVEIACGPGFMDIKKAGLRSTRIRAKSIVGATTARTSRGVLLTLSLKGRDEPIAIEVEHDADADRIRKALGVGHYGFGTIGFRTAPSPIGWSNLAWLFLTGPFGVLLFKLTKLLYGHGPPNIVMMPEGLRILTPRGTYDVPYACVRDVERSKGSVTVSTTFPNVPRVDVPAAGTWRGLSDEAMRNFKAQVMSAVSRAQGMGTQKEDVSVRVDNLRRRGESPREWLSRLDTVGQLLSTSAGYRSHSIDAADLWTVLEDPDADVELRTAAARVLCHSREPNARVRVDASLATAHDSATNKLRIAVEDNLEIASTQLDYLDAIDGRTKGPLRR